MISDAEFWMEVRRKNGNGNALFCNMFALIHARQTALEAGTVTIDREEYNITTIGMARRDSADGKVLTSEEKKRSGEDRQEWKRRLKELEAPFEQNKAVQLPNVPPRRVATISLRILQQIMMFAVPIYSLRYNVPAMSMSWNTSCFIERPSKHLITFGAGQGVKVPQLLHGRGCVAGDGFFAILSDDDEVWASGGLKVSSSSGNNHTPLGREDTMTGIAGRTLMLVGHGQRLASVTRAFTVRPLSALSNPTRSILPSRHVRFLDLGYGEDCYMVGTDSMVYKTTASKRAVSTPRRVLTLCRTPVSRVASGTSFLLVIDQNGHLYSQGRNRKGQLGNGERQEAHRKPYLQSNLLHHFFTQVSAGDCHSLALASSGLVYGAGSNENGQLGLGPNVKEALSFTHIPLPCKCVGIAAGPAGSMFACEDGQVLTCGLNDSMQLGIDNADNIVWEPTAISGLRSGVESYTLDFGGYPDWPAPMENIDSALTASAVESPGDATKSKGGCNDTMTMEPRTQDQINSRIESTRTHNAQVANNGDESHAPDYGEGHGPPPSPDVHRGADTSDGAVGSSSPPVRTRPHKGKAPNQQQKTKNSCGCCSPM